jgi:hypothetical protein
MLVNVQSSDSLLKVIIRAMSFPALIGELMLIAIVIKNPDHSVRNTLSELVFTSLWMALSSMPFIGFSLLRWQTLRSRASTGALKQR